MKGKIRLAALLPFVAAAFALAVGGTANATTSPTTTSAITAISNRPDGGHGTPGTWAYDNFSRKLTVSVAANQSTCSGLPAGDTCYTATLADNGTFNTILGAGTPNGTGGQISHQVSGSLVGSASYIFYAPNADTLTGTVPTTENDNFTSPISGRGSSVWPSLAFANPAAVVMTPGENVYSYKYMSTCESWTDSSANGDGVGASDGNITGVNFCVVAQSNAVQVKNRATGRCLNENQANGQLLTFACYSATYASLQWKVVTFSDGTKSLMSVQTGKYVKDNGTSAQLSLTATPTPMNFINGGVFQFAGDGQVMTVNQQGNFVPVVGEPGTNPLNNGRWDFGALA